MFSSFAFFTWLQAQLTSSTEASAFDGSNLDYPTCPNGSQTSPLQLHHYKDFFFYLVSPWLQDFNNYFEFTTEFQVITKRAKYSTRW